MIYLDRYGLSFLVSEIKNEVVGYKIQKVVGYDANSFSLLINKKNIYFENKEQAIVFVTREKNQKTYFENNFILKLKKNLVGSIIEDVFQYENDRVVIFKLDKIDMFGNRIKQNLIFELLGKSINVLLIDDNEIVITQLYNNIKLDRLNFPNSKYEYPQISNYSGKYFDNLTQEKKEEFKTKYTPVYYPNRNILTYNEFFEEDKIVYSTLNEAITKYFEINSNISSIKNVKNPLMKFVHNNIKRIEKILTKIPDEMDENKDYEKYKEMADVLASNMYLIKKDMNSIILFNYYTNSDIKIKLDSRLTPSKNVEKYYNQYAKAKRKQKILQERVNYLQNELEYYKEQLIYIQNENDLQGLDDIANSLGIISSIKKKKEQKRPLLSYEYKDAVIYVGRNSNENDYITFTLANSNDTWLHIRDVAGSHIIIKGRIDDSVIEYASLLAIKHSNLEQGNVDYCQKKYVKKMPQGKKGQVIFSNYKTIFVKKEEI